MTSPSGCRLPAGHSVPLFDQLGSSSARVSIRKLCDESEGGADDTGRRGQGGGGRGSELENQKQHRIIAAVCRLLTTLLIAAPTPGSRGGGASPALAPN